MKLPNASELKPYPAMKDSGVEWLGDVPKPWEVQRADRRLSVVKQPVDPNEISDQQVVHYSIPNVQQAGRGVIELGRSIDSAKTLVDRVLLLVSKLNPRKGTVALAVPDPELITLASSEFVAMEPKFCLAEFARYLFESEHVRLELSSRVDSATKSHQRCSPEDISKLPVPWPSLPEQSAIVRFLHHADRRIRRYIRAKQKLIALLEEQKQAIIHQAVTGQIDVRTGRPYPSYKDSGVEWLGAVPEHWEVKKLSWLFRYSKGFNAATLTNEYIGKHPGKFPVYSGQTENNGLMGTIDSFEFEFPMPAILVTTVGAKAMSTRIIGGRFSLSQNCALIVPRERTLDTVYFEGVLRRMFDFERRSISLIMQPSLRFEDLDKFRVPIPSIGEQYAISGFIVRHVAEIDCAITHADRGIELLQEYRTRLIADAVTGKLDVREASAELPEEDLSGDAEESAEEQGIKK